MHRDAVVGVASSHFVLWALWSLFLSSFLGESTKTSAEKAVPSEDGGPCIKPGESIGEVVQRAREKFHGDWDVAADADKDEMRNDEGEKILRFPPELYSAYRSAIRADLEPWLGGIGGISRDALERARTAAGVVKYQIFDGRLYRQKEPCVLPVRCLGVEHFLLELLADPSDGLPNMELIVNVHDHPRVHREMANRMGGGGGGGGGAAGGEGGGGPPALFSFSKTDDYLDIMYPAWAFWEGGPAVWPIYPTGLGRWDVLRTDLSAKAREIPWAEKEKRAYFRGSRTSSERDSLILLSRAKPHQADAAYTKNQSWKSDADTLDMPPAEPTHILEHCRFAYQFNFRGVAASFRLKHLFLCGSLVFHVGDEWQEFFYGALRPWVHYVPVSTEMTEVEELLTFFRENDEMAQRIAEEGYKLIWDHLRMEDVTLYWRILLQNYARLLNFEVELDSEMEYIGGKGPVVVSDKSEL